MASASRALDPYVTPQEHEQIEQESGQRFEWFDGHIFAMAGGTPVHNAIGVNIAASLHQQLRGKPCRPWGSDQQVKVPQSRTVVYPDVSVGCPPHEWDEQHRNALTNPVVIIEVLSPSTEKHDRGRKFTLYASIPSVRHYVLVSTEARHIEHFERAQGGWLQQSAPRDGDCLSLSSIGCRLCLDDVYEATVVPLEEELPEEAEGEQAGQG